MLLKFIAFFANIAIIVICILFTNLWFLWVVKFKEKIIHLGGLLTFDATFWIRNICCQATLILRKKRLIFNSQVVPKRDLARYIKWNKLFCVSVQLFMNAMDWNMIEILDCLKDIRFGKFCISNNNIISYRTF